MASHVSEFFFYFLCFLPFYVFLGGRPFCLRVRVSASLTLPMSSGMTNFHKNRTKGIWSNNLCFSCGPFDHFLVFRPKKKQKHRKNCKCCPVSLLIARSFGLSWIKFLNCHIYISKLPHYHHNYHCKHHCHHRNFFSQKRAKRCFSHPKQVCKFRSYSSLKLRLTHSQG